MDSNRHTLAIINFVADVMWCYLQLVPGSELTEPKRCERIVLMDGDVPSN